jgi:sec-independent protein translocase protein TatA
MNLFLAFAFGGPEMIFVFILMLLLFGAKKLPGLARGVGQSLGEFKKARKEFEDEIHLAQDIDSDVSPKPKKKPMNVSTAPKKVDTDQSTSDDTTPVGAKGNKADVG